MCYSNIKIASPSQLERCQVAFVGAQSVQSEFRAVKECVNEIAPQAYYPTVPPFIPQNSGNPSVILVPYKYTDGVFGGGNIPPKA